MAATQPSAFPPDLGKAALRALAEAGYSRLEELAEVAEVALQGLPGIETKTMAQLRAALDTQGLAFAAPSDFPTTLGRPALRALATGGYTHLGQLTQTTESDLLALHGMGAKGVRLLREALEAQGLAFATSKKG